MNDVSKPPPSPGVTFAAATAGGFVGAVAGAIVAAGMMGDSNSDANLDKPEADEQVLVAEGKK
jgi:Na+/glutamate symporter